MTAEPAGSRPAVQPQAPPAALLKVGNAMFRTLLRSPLHGVVSGSFVVLHVTGRKTGRRYDVGVGRHDVEGGLLVVTSVPWRKNFAGGAPLEVTVGGRRRPAHGDLLEDPDVVADLYLAQIERLGWKRGNRLGIKINVGRTPTHEELADAVRRDNLSVVRIRYS